VIEFVDIAGLVKGAHKGEGLGNQFLANIREVDLICQVVRCFESENIKHVEENHSPKEDIDIINTELALADLATLQKRRVKTQKEARGNNKEAILELAVLEKVEAQLNQGKPVAILDLSKEEQEILKGLHFLTAKPTLFLLNLAEKNHPQTESLINTISHLKLDIKTEEELLLLSPEEAIELGLESNLTSLPQKAYAELDLITFFTTGETESRAWTIPKNSTAPEAGARIHNDFKDKFIRAEVVSYNDFTRLGSFAKARESGALRTEGRDYVVADGDVIIFKI
jgi:GTP-binding protein YchF